MYRLALESHEKSLGRLNKDTKDCAYNLAVLLEKIGTQKQELRKVLDEYPHLEQAGSWDV